MGKKVGLRGKSEWEESETGEESWNEGGQSDHEESENVKKVGLGREIRK
jgi:hypothetical protein